MGAQNVTLAPDERGSDLGFGTKLLVRFMLLRELLPLVISHINLRFGAYGCLKRDLHPALRGPKIRKRGRSSAADQSFLISDDLNGKS